MTAKQNLIVTAVCALAWVGADQFSKALFKNILVPGDMMSYGAGAFLIYPTYNPGAFLGLGAGMSIEARNLVFIYGVLLILGGVFTWLLRSKSLARSQVIAIASILGGGLSNLYDRVVYNGHVYDFLNIGIGELRTGVFNIADVGIMFGALLLLIFSRARTKS